MTTDRDLLVAALRGFELMKRGLDAVMAEIRGELGKTVYMPSRRLLPLGNLDLAASRSAVSVSRKARKLASVSKRKLSAAARKAIGDAQRKRWKAYHKARKAA